MNIHRFDRPVSIALGPAGNKLHIVSDIKQAQEVLLNRWPKEAGSKHLAACQAVKAVLKGQRKAVFARLAFADAAREADILIDDGDAQ